MKNNDLAIKIFNRLCKESGVFLTSYYKNIIRFFEENNSYIYYGHDGQGYSMYDVGFECRFFKLQLDFLRKLIENNILSNLDYNKVLTDTLGRYNYNKHYYDTCYNRYKEVCEKTERELFVIFFIEKYEKKFNMLFENHEKDKLIYFAN